MTALASPDPAVPWLRAAALALTACLVLLGLAWELWLAPTGRGTLALKVLPLVLTLPGLLRHRLYTYRALSLLVWLYAAEGATRVTSEHGRESVLAASEVLLVLVLFTVLVLYIRGRLRAAVAA